MGQVTVKALEWGDDRAMAPNLRLADQREAISGTGLSPDDALYMSVRHSDQFWVGWDDNVPIAIFGYIDSSSDEGTAANVWLLGTDRVKAVRWQFLRKSKEWMDRVAANYDILWAVSDSRNKVHQKWYEWLGFKVVQTLLVGPYSLPFNHIIYTKGDTNV